jgi:hypothetical protein
MARGEGERHRAPVERRERARVDGGRAERPEGPPPAVLDRGQALESQVGAPTVAEPTVLVLRGEHERQVMLSPHCVGG